MTILMYYLTIIISCGIFVGLYFIFKNKIGEKTQTALKIVSLILAVFFSIRYYWSSELIENTIGLEGSPLSSKFLTVISSFAIWFNYTSVLLLIIYPFFKTKVLSVMVKFFAFPVAILNLLTFIPQSIGISGQVICDEFSLRIFFFAIEIALTLIYSLYLFLKDGNFKSTKKDWISYAILIVPMLLCTMPSFTLQLLFGLGRITEKVKNLTPYHRLVLYFAIIIPTVIYFLLRNKDEDYKKMCLTFIALGTMITFTRNYTFVTLLHPTQWPLHLCNTAMFLVPLCLIFKLDKLFYFTLFINVFGAFLAMAIPNYSPAGTLSASIINFWVNHYCAFFMPILIVALKIYKRPKLKNFLQSMVGFAMYFALVLVVNAWFSNYGSVDFFFINSDFIADKLGDWAKNLRDIVWEIKFSDTFSLKFTPLYQALFFVVYCIMGLGVWFVIEQFFTISDEHYDMLKRKRKIKLDRLALESQLNGRSEMEPMYEENTNKLIIKDLCKRYGTSDVYAVYKANLEVNGGEIFGFLGPNGAGKSTIIKSIVGIQPISSGTVEVCGYDAEKQSVMAKRQIGFVPDHYALYEKLTGREYINYIADLYDVNQEDRDVRIKKYVDLFELNGAFDNQMKTYSHGMKQKIAIMAALVHNPKIWILDEPLTGLDPNSIFQVKECMKIHAKEGNIVFFSSHIIDVVERICDRITIIKKGQIRTTKTIKELDDEGIKLEDFYLDIINKEDNDAIVCKTCQKEDAVKDPKKIVETKVKPKKDKVKDRTKSKKQDKSKDNK